MEQWAQRVAAVRGQRCRWCWRLVSKQPGRMRGVRLTVYENGVCPCGQAGVEQRAVESGAHSRA